MTPERWREVERICQTALELPPAERAHFLSHECGGDESLRHDVERLLAQDSAAPAFLETPAMAVAAQMMGSGDHALREGQQIGAYTVLSSLGVGGMGEVYRARDTTLGRDVAIKVLPTIFTSDAGRLARFEREARLLAALNHPNVATIHGVERVDGIHALILEVVEGETLEERLARSAVPLSEALIIARQTADALDAAHDKGIVHRDLKPANIKIRPDGVVKVLDFGLAKAIAPTGGAEASHSPTMAIGRTHDGMVLGTAAYMSPEQASGKPADKRADIWAFGVVLFEMLSGLRAFSGDRTVEVLSNVLKTEPEWNALPLQTPAGVRSLIRRCLQKDPARRLRDIADARFHIDEAQNEPSGAPTPMSMRPSRLMLATGVVASFFAVLGTIWLRPQARPNADEVRFEVDVPPTADPSSLAISPNGKLLVFVGISEGKSRLWLRSLDRVSVRPLAGTDNARFPFWSPDSRSIGFSANGQLKRVDAEGGSVQVIVSSGAQGGGTWNQNGSILYDPGAGLVFQLVGADGGEPTSLTLNIPFSEDDPGFPQFLPDDRHFLFHATGSATGIYVGELGARDPPRQLLAAAQAATYTSGHLLFVRQGTLFAQAFDPAQQKLTGTPISMADQIVVGQNEGTAALSVSASGTIIYRTAASDSRTQFAWFDRSGNRLKAIVGSDIGTGFNSSLSPNGNLLALSSRLAGAVSADIWSLDLGRGVPTRLTVDAAVEVIPVWSPDSLRIAFTSNRRTGTGFDLYVRPASPTGADELLVAMDGSNETPSDWSPDGRFILFARDRGAINGDIWAFQLEGRRAFPVVETKFSEGNAQFSPDGRWIAYQSDESGQMEIWVQPFQRPGGKVQVSSGGGIQMRWRGDGREIFYLTPDGRIVAVPIQFDSSRDSPLIGTPVSLFAPNLSGTPRQLGSRHYAVTQDGQRFLVDTLKEVTLPVTVVLHWKPQP